MSEQIMSELGYLYRYEEQFTAPMLDEFENPVGVGGVNLFLYEIPVLKRTPCGAWVRSYTGRKFVNLNAGKKYACVSPEDAWISYLARKHRQQQILVGQLHRVRRALQLQPEYAVPIRLTGFQY